MSTAPDGLGHHCAAPFMVLTVEAEGRHLETVGRRGQEWAVQRGE